MSGNYDRCAKCGCVSETAGHLFHFCSPECLSWWLNNWARARDWPGDITRDDFHLGVECPVCDVRFAGSKSRTACRECVARNVGNSPDGGKP